MRLSLTAVVVTAGLCLMIAGLVWADGTEEPQTAVKLYRGTSIIAASDPNHATYRANFTLDACMALKTQRWEAEAATKTSGPKVTYRCQLEERSIITFHRPPACAPPRAPETQQVACPNDPQRMFTQTQTWTIAPAPTCEIAGAWLPVTPSVTDCPPTQLPAPTGVEATVISTSEIRIKWNVVPDAVAYSLRRCIGTTCDPMAFPRLTCTQRLEQPHVTLNPGITVRYQVEAARAADCSGELSVPSSPVVSATTLTSGGTPNPPIPDPPPSVCVDRVCTMNWTPGAPLPGAPVAGFRVVYGRSPTELIRSVQTDDPNARSLQMPVDAAGVWYFATIAYTADGRDSDWSNVLMVTVQ